MSMSTTRTTNVRRPCPKCGHVRLVKHHVVRLDGKVAHEWWECPLHGVIEGQGPSGG